MGRSTQQEKGKAKFETQAGSKSTAGSSRSGDAAAEEYQNADLPHQLLESHKPFSSDAKAEQRQAKVQRMKPGKSAGAGGAPATAAESEQSSGAAKTLRGRLSWAAPGTQEGKAVEVGCSRA